MDTVAANKRRNRLTARFVATVVKPGKHHDGGGLGLYLRVLPGGSKQWVQRIVARGRRQEIGLGSPPVVTLAKAREVALENKRIARDGHDPLQMKREAAAVLTFAEAARKVHAMHAPTWRNAKHGRDFINSLEAYAFPRLGKHRVADITPADVLAVLTPIWTEKPETARRVRQRIGTVMKWAVAQGWRLDNPAESIAKALPKHDRKVKAHRKALPYADVAKCIDAVRASSAGRDPAAKTRPAGSPQGQSLQCPCTRFGSAAPCSNAQRIWSGGGGRNAATGWCTVATHHPQTWRSAHGLHGADEVSSTARQLYHQM
jgi:hypothetical protein